MSPNQMMMLARNQESIIELRLSEHPSAPYRPILQQETIAEVDDDFEYSHESSKISQKYFNTNLRSSHGKTDNLKLQFMHSVEKENSDPNSNLKTKHKTYSKN